MNCTGLKELLEAFVAKDCEDSDYPSELDGLLSDTARTGVVKFSWPLLKPLLKFRLESVLKSEALTKTPEDDKGDFPMQLSRRLDTFDNPPFTIQRLCELVMYPRKHYKNRVQFMRAMEKNLMVVSTQEPDLTWMKSPRLTQHLEKPTVVTNGPNHNHTFNHTPGNVASADTAEHLTTTTSISSPPLGSKDNVLSETAVTADQEKAHPSQTQEVTRLSPSGLPRKRGSSLRDSPESGGSGSGGCGNAELEAMGLVLQEADSTTIEHLHPSEGSHAHPSSESNHARPLLEGSHTHSLSESNHAHPLLEGSHAHPLSESNHAHPLLEGSHTHSLSESSHTHPSLNSSSEGSEGSKLQQAEDGIQVVGGASVWAEPVPEEKRCKESELFLGMEECGSVKKMRYLDVIGAREGVADRGDSDVRGGGNSDVRVCGNSDVRVCGNSDVSSGSIEEAGDPEMEARQTKETYKEAATGQMELETQSTTNQHPPGQMENS